MYLAMHTAAFKDSTLVVASMCCITRHPCLDMFRPGDLHLTHLATCSYAQNKWYVGWIIQVDKFTMTKYTSKDGWKGARNA